MPSYSENRVLPYNIHQLYDIVADIAKYPEFLPWCRAARILKRDENVLLAELVISFGIYTESYVSRVSLTPPSQEEGKSTYPYIATITAELEKGPFTHLNNHWMFRRISENQTEIDFSVDFDFKSKILSKLIGSMFDSVTRKMIGAFEKRASLLKDSWI